MSTRATISVIDKHDQFDIYRHYDGYAHGAHGVVHDIRAAVARAWPLPRFEAGDFAAATVAQMKQVPGSIYLTRAADHHADRSFHYDVRFAENALQLTVHGYCERINDVVPIFTGTLAEAIDKYDAHERVEEITPVGPGDIWAALALAEMALADPDVARTKGYLAKAKEQIFTAMDAKRAGKADMVLLPETQASITNALENAALDINQACKWRPDVDRKRVLVEIEKAKKLLS